MSEQELQRARGRPVKRGLQEETIRKIEQAAARVATQSVARMEDELPWFRTLPADQRSWVMLVAQAGIASFVEWLRSPDDVLRLTGEVFGTAPRAMARTVTLQHTVELVEQAITVAEQQVPLLAARGDEGALREELLRFSREIAFAAARVYAGAAESRGAWDARLEALVIDGLVRGGGIGGEPESQIAALGWRTAGPVTTVAGVASDQEHAQDILAEAHRLAHRSNYDAIAGVHGGRLIVVLGGIADPLTAARDILAVFADGPVVVGWSASDVAGAAAVTRAALSGLRAAPGWGGAPRPVSAEALLPERALAGDAEARDDLLEHVYRPLAKAGEVLLETVTAFLEAGGSLEATARTLFVHPNTVRYRLRRVGELCGESPTVPRGAYVIHIALTLGRLETSA
jgi:PucR C-terminal helix-turn-helix domain/GGDEF-like domain